MDEPFIRAVELRRDADRAQPEGYPWDLPAISALAARLPLHRRVTYLIGENGSGKSTPLEAIAVAAGMNAEGGSSNFAFSTRDSHSELWRAVRVVRGARRPATDFFLRAESLFTAATYLEELPTAFDADPLLPYGGGSLHEQSLVGDGSQFIIATHSPIILAYPDAMIYACTEDGLEEVEYEDADPVRLTQSFLQARARFLDQLFAD